MKPKLNSKVYIIAYEEIYAELVGWLGSASFVIKEYEIKIKTEFYYDDYGNTWVKTLKEAKAILKERLGKDAKIVRLDDDWWGEEEE